MTEKSTFEMMDGRKPGQSVMPLQTHTVKNPQGKIYSYRGHKIAFWFSEDEIDVLERAYNYIQSTKHQDFTDRERSTISKFSKAVIMKYSKMIKKKYVDRK